MILMYSINDNTPSGGLSFRGFVVHTEGGTHNGNGHLGKISAFALSALPEMSAWEYFRGGVASCELYLAVTSFGSIKQEGWYSFSYRN